MDASIFDVNLAKSLLIEPTAAVALVTRTKHVTLPPCYMGRLRTGLKDILSTELKRYSELLGGVLIGYENIRLVQSFGQIHSDEPYLHFDVQADFLIFQPQIGSTLKGVVNRISKNHVSCLVHNCFNASLPRPASSEVDWLGDSVAMKQEVFFEVTYLDLLSHVIFIRGAIASLGEKPATLSVEDTVATIIDDALERHPLVNGGDSVDESVSEKVGLKSKESYNRRASVTFDVTPPEIAKRRKLKLGAQPPPENENQQKIVNDVCLPNLQQNEEDSSSAAVVIQKTKRKNHDSVNSDSSSFKKKKSPDKNDGDKDEKSHKKFKKHKDRDKEGKSSKKLKKSKDKKDRTKTKKHKKDKEKHKSKSSPDKKKKKKKKSKHDAD